MRECALLPSAVPGQPCARRLAFWAFLWQFARLHLGCGRDICIDESDCFLEQCLVVLQGVDNALLGPGPLVNLDVDRFLNNINLQVDLQGRKYGSCQGWFSQTPARPTAHSHTLTHTHTHTHTSLSRKQPFPVP